MVTVILHKTSSETDVARFSEIIDTDIGNSLHVLSAEDIGGKNVVELYIDIANSSDDASDILLISDSIRMHGNVFEKMKSCLHIAEKHAIVVGQEIEQKESLIETACEYLPEYSLTAEVDVRCVLIKRRAINTLGFFDASYKTLEYALLDYYCRINRYGFSALVAHKALFSSIENASVRDIDTGLTNDEKLFLSKYPYWTEKERRTEQISANVCLDFIKLVDEKYYPKKRILFDCIVMPAMHCGTSEYQKSVLEAFHRLYKDKYDIYLYVHRESAEYHNLSSMYDNIIYPDEVEKKNEKFHLGFAPNQLVHYEHQFVMNDRCLKIVQTMFDIIMVRVDEHVDVDAGGDVELGIRMSDGIAFISEFTKNDLLACYANSGALKDKRLKVIYPATGLGVSAKADYELPFDEYFLIAGNLYRHKAVCDAIEAVSGSEHNFIVVGYGENEYIESNVYSYKGGNIDDDFLCYLYANCTAVIFPSLYEGFGLPLVIGFSHNKRVILSNGELNDELYEHFEKFQDHFIFFDCFEQIGELIKRTDFSKELVEAKYDDTWDRVATELETFFADVLSAGIDTEALRARRELFNMIESKLIKPKETIAMQEKELDSLHNQFGDYKLHKLLKFAMKECVKNRHEKLFGFLKGESEV